MRALKIYEVNPIYVKYLSSFQEHIFVSDGEKSSRKYIGIILEVNGYKYFAPLSSFKPKHAKMAEGVDFIKIKDYAVISLLYICGHIYRTIVDVCGAFNITHCIKRYVIKTATNFNLYGC